jgi:hypothetical protein
MANAAKQLEALFLHTEHRLLCIFEVGLFTFSIIFELFDKKQKPGLTMLADDLPSIAGDQV